MANVGQPQRIIEVEPIQLPVEIPQQQPQQQPAEPQGPPVYRPQEDPTPAIPVPTR